MNQASTQASNKANVAAKIKALLSKTVENGATEAEAFAAMTKAHELLEKYQLTLSAVELAVDGFSKDFMENSTSKVDEFGRKIAVCVGKYTDCRVWIDNHTSKKKVTFFGLKSDVEFAKWIYVTLCGFAQRESRLHLTAERNAGRIHDNGFLCQISFLTGAARRINERMYAEIAARKPQATSTGQSLVVVKSALVNAEFAKLGLKLKTGKSSDRKIDGNAMAGRSAGDRASWSRPVGGGSGGQLQIGSR